jgi:hypothetical protein
MSTIVGRAPAAALLILPALGAAHVPYLEERDYGAGTPLAIENVTNSKGSGS